MFKPSPYRVMILGGGNIGIATAKMLAPLADTTIFVLGSEKEKVIKDVHNHNVKVEVFVDDNLAKNLEILPPGYDILINALPHTLNRIVMEAIRKHPIHYFDYSEDVFYTTNHDWSKHYPKAFVPHCGLAPGYINILGGHIIRTNFIPVSDLSLSVGSLPITRPTNSLTHEYSWSLDGLINEYVNPCTTIQDGKILKTKPFDDCNIFQFNKENYEQFNTSGGIGTLPETFAGDDHLKNLKYQTIRYAGHVVVFQQFIDKFKLDTNLYLFKEMLKHCMKPTREDKVLIRVEINKDKHNVYMKQILGNNELTAIQLATASGCVGVIEMLLKLPSSWPTGFIRQENIDYNKFIETKHGSLFK